MKRQYIYMVCATALLSSCHIYKAYDRPDSIETSGIYRDPIAEAAPLATTDTTNIANLPWQTLFQDSKLQALITEGLANNVDLQAAILRIDEAKALLTSARLAYLPSINASAAGELYSYDGADPTKTYRIAGAASWEVDLFGKLLNASRGQRAAYLKSQYSCQAVRSQVICGIANSYYTLLMLDRQVDITSQTVAIYKENVRVMEAMKEAGMTTEAAVVQMRAALHQVEASLIELNRSSREVENALSVLLMRTPGPIERGSLDHQEMPKDLLVGVPLQLLENRPDVKVAEMSLASAYYQTNQARSAFYPSVTITANAGWLNGSAGNKLPNPGQFMWDAIGQLAQPIFNRGKLIANLKVTKAEEQIAKMNYQQAILKAGKEVSDALYLYDATERKLIEDQGRVDQLTKAVSYTKDLFESGSASYLEILTAQQNLLNAQLAEVADNVQRIQAVITLYSALGGGRE